MGCFRLDYCSSLLIPVVGTPYGNHPTEGHLTIIDFMNKGTGSRTFDYNKRHEFMRAIRKDDIKEKKFCSKSGECSFNMISKGFHHSGFGFAWA